MRAETEAVEDGSAPAHERVERSRAVPRTIPPPRPTASWITSTPADVAGDTGDTRDRRDPRDPGVTPVTRTTGVTEATDARPDAVRAARMRPQAATLLAGLVTVVITAAGWTAVALRASTVLSDVRAQGPDAVLVSGAVTTTDLLLFVAGLVALVPALARLAVIDARTLRLPDTWTRPLVAAVAAWLAALTAAGTITVAGLGRCVLAGAALHLAYRLWRAISPGGRAVGLGDAKLATALGLLLGLRGWGHVAAGAFLGIALAGLVAAALLLTRRVARSDALPHGPFMILGTALALLGP